MVRFCVCVCGCGCLPRGLRGERCVCVCVCMLVWGALGRCGVQDWGAAGAGAGPGAVPGGGYGGEETGSAHTPHSTLRSHASVQRWPCHFTVCENIQDQYTV